MSLRKSRFEVSAMNSSNIQSFLAGSALLLVGFVAGLLLGSRPTVPES
jgi:predicted transcriptional regulator